MSASIFMTVGIALERYIAVHYPIGKDIHACVELHHLFLYADHILDNIHDLVLGENCFIGGL